MAPRNDFISHAYLRIRMLTDRLIGSDTSRTFVSSRAHLRHYVINLIALSFGIKMADYRYKRLYVTVLALALA